MEVLFTQPNVELNQQVRLLTIGNAFSTPTSFFDTVQHVHVYRSLVECYRHMECCCVTVFCVVGTGI